ncbi:MAG TPA: transglycosylase domain-containing protein, partial [Actinomycetota bacterium]|nr:transglycosylase domain-containing protein [Actinomycetota bacterium]
MAAPPKARRGPKHASRTTKTQQRRGFFRRYWWLFVAVPLGGLLILVGTLTFVYSRLQLPQTPPPLQTTHLYDRTGKHLLATLHASVDRTIIPFDQMPASVRNAVIAVEDQDFYSHPGIDPLGIVRAAWSDLVSHQVVQGGSTITQQLVKNVYAGHYEHDPKTGQTTYVVPPRTFGQKVREALLAIKLEQSYTKDQILTTYLNTIYFGHGAYGVEAAAQTYFGKHAAELTLVQSATLAGLIRNPSSFDPIVNPGNAFVRRNYVLERMAQVGDITQARADALERTKVKAVKGGSELSFPPKLGYFLDYARRTLIDRFDEGTVFGGGLHVTTSLDERMQHAAEAAVAGRLRSKGDPEAALVAVDPSTGEVRAMYGGRNFGASQVNLALSGAKGFGGTGRQAGSAFKPFTLAAAMEDHVSLSSRWRGPGRITIPDRRCYTDGKPWTLSNASDEESGDFTLAQATAHSVNTVYAQLVSMVGPDRVVDVAHRMGIRSPLKPVCSITLGTQSVNPLEMTNAYATLAARGVYRPATPLRQVTTPGGQTELKSSRKGRRALDQNDADLVTYALRGVIAGGTGTNANIGRPAAGKTGTAQSYVDAWFCGYVPQLATCVWVGYPKGEIPLTYVEGFPAVYGGTIPALIWHDFMSEAVGSMPVRDFATPSFSGYTRGAPTPPPSLAPSKSP